MKSWMTRKLLIYGMFFVAMSYALPNITCRPSRTTDFQVLVQEVRHNRFYFEEPVLDEPRMVDISYVEEYSVGFPVAWILISRVPFDMTQPPFSGEEQFRWEVHWAFLGLNCVFLVAVAVVIYFSLSSHFHPISFSIADALCFLIVAAILFMIYSPTLGFVGLVVATCLLALMLPLIICRLVRRVPMRDPFLGDAS